MSGPIQERFEKTIKLLKEKEARFALAGGYASSLYRKQERFTKDIDFIIWTDGNVVEDSKQILEQLGLIAEEVREAQLKGGPLHKIKTQMTPVWIVAGRSKNKKDVPVDFLIHTIPWMLTALERAQLNEQDIGFGWKLPVITAEDVLLAKFMALEHKADRIEDLSDIREIFSNLKPDLTYLVGRMKDYKIICPKEAEKYVPAIVRTISKEIRSSKK